MSAAPITFERVDAECPHQTRRGRPAVNRDTMFDLLGTMEPGGLAVDVNRAARSVQGYVHRYRVAHDREAQFVLREARPGWTRIWRVK